MKKRVGLIGCGSITIIRHAPEYRANPYCEIAGFFDPILDRAEYLAGEYNVCVYASLDNMLNDRTIDAVSVNSTNDTHSAIAIAAMEHGKHVLVEKPMATNLGDASEMIRVSSKTNKILMVAHNQRFVPAHVKAKSLIDSDTLGQITSFRVCFKHGGPENWAVDKNSSTWYFDKSRVAFGVISDLGIHKLDLIRYLLGREIETVFCTGATCEKYDHFGKPIEVPDTSFALLRFQEGILGSMEVSWCNHGIMEDEVVIYGTKGVMRVCAGPNYSLIVEMKNREHLKWVLPERENGSGVIDAFIDAINNNKTSPVGGYDVLNTMAALEACFESSQTGKWIRLK